MLASVVLAAVTLSTVALAAAGCATPEWAMVGGKRVARPTLGYSDGASFAIVHHRAFPDVFDPLRGRDVDDGTITGKVCGMDLAFDASWYGPRLTLSGRGEVAWQNTFTHTEGLFGLALNIVELGPGHRHITGRMTSGLFTIDIDASADRLRAEIGSRTIDLAAGDDDYLFGRIRRHGDVIRDVDAPYAIYGRHVLATMVPADEALLLVTMLTCNGPAIAYDGKQVRGFSLVRLPSLGPAESSPPQSPRIEPEPPSSPAPPAPAPAPTAPSSPTPLAPAPTPPPAPAPLAPAPTPPPSPAPLTPPPTPPPSPSPLTPESTAPPSGA